CQNEHGVGGKSYRDGESAQELAVVTIGICHGFNTIVDIGHGAEGLVVKRNIGRCQEWADECAKGHTLKPRRERSDRIDDAGSHVLLEGESD
ncbi:MAG: hypothetical protein KGO23_03590, partial [Nitrospirota bacterium]|nr:hypothetical protein [Nitrospirota bacterium]